MTFGREEHVWIPESDLEGMSVDTLAVRAGQIRTGQLEHSDAIFPTSSFVYGSAAQAAARFGGEEPGNIYSRFTNPTVQAFEARIAAMEGGERGVATASGMAAILSTCMSLLKSGDHVICSRGVFGTTNVLFQKYMARFGVETSFVSLTNTDEWKAEVRPATRMLFLETPSNPLCEVADLAALSAIARENDALLVVDNCFCTPVLQRPLEQGADIVIHSATKYLDGQGRCVGGVVVGPARYLDEIYGFLRSAGPTMSPFNAWVFQKGLETLPIRMRAHCDNALELALWLEQQDCVEKVYYAGLRSHPQHELAKKQQDGFGGVLSFLVRGGREQAWKFIDATRMISITANLGDVKTTITHPATTTHGRLSPEDKARAGITENLIRLSVGIESIKDLKTDLDRGFQALKD
ncbi:MULTISPECIES: O-succinylhomoserine sulfhydrylase [Marinobacter]|jgi:O-succinylhomoserine sulfhydrylase|uniref:O-succinylhomoserine sulfhydrylase n=3 Tax=Marinobacter nauticus TaxID=2743 RepID=A0A368XWL2_MARNT|nr:MULTISPECIES: O-succinylhomoserine sulfhydrylase [Marinobacter]MAC22895.1 O-succinylhomoserine sulfhydrylase [Marinobacter sp.]MAL33681.1 O-succinylhomoserine sulfhydrylase [Marinobacter sp.]MBH91453.1 O-succinylhomoserine sulfhydrylase [Marinobacter sp.]MBU40707.1 O-succinylhomoserine sulfhydrylase [Marinobacter sp.]MCS5560423.1 O-succinylhomoserine sulfhydrylase [Marinobacter nauticus]|tara:strand:- start:1693 stop:2916 length:1224 start_codon:yes stop_codon:yes gene_type:complete